MSLWLISFIASGSALVLLVLVKMIQNYFEIMLFWPEARQRIEKRVRRRTLKINKNIQEVSSKSVYIFLHFFISKTKGVLIVLHGWLDRKSHRLVSLIRGKQRIDARGKASYFLNDVASFRERFRKR